MQRGAQMLNRIGEYTFSLFGIREPLRVRGQLPLLIS